MSKKVLIAEGYFDDDYVAPEEHHAPIEVPTAEIITDEFFCQFCSQGFMTEKGVSIHEKRWCKERLDKLQEAIDDEWQEI